MDTRKTGGPSRLLGIRTTLAREAERRRTERGALFCDVLVLALSFFFARRHIAFGSYPLAAALVATLPDRVWISLIGAAVGSLSLGRSGVIHAVTAVIVVFLRIAISGGRREEGERLFSEPFVMRCAAATVASFVGAAYGILLEGFSLSAVLFGVAGVLFTTLAAGVFYGVFFTGVSFSEVVYGTGKIFTLREDGDRWRIALFSVSVLTVSSLVSLSLEEYVFFGISLSYVYTASVTLFAAKRFGALRAMATGFFSAISVSASGGVAFALAGLGAGSLFSIGAAYALIGGAALLSLWSAYDGGLSGFLSTFPEYTVSGLLLFPILRNTPREGAGEETDEGKARGESSCEDMVKLFSMSYRADTRGYFDISDSLAGAAAAVRRYGGDSEPEFLDYRRIIIDSISGVSPYPCEENIEIIATKLYKKQRLERNEARELLGEGGIERLDIIIKGVREYERECLCGGRVEALSREYELVRTILSETESERTRECTINAALTKKAKETLAPFCTPELCVAVLGERRVHVIVADTCASGEELVSDGVLATLESALGVRLDVGESYRRGERVIWESSAVEKFSLVCASAAFSGGGEVSGDSIRFFERGGYFYSLISDGMGSGELARATSALAVDFLSATVTGGGTVSASFGALNQLIRYSGGECSATVDLFSFDKLSGEAVFIKSGAAPSYIKRGNSIFRVRASTAPIGLSSSVDAEKIRVEVREGDIIFMLTDGVSPLAEDTAPLVELLSGTDSREPEELADKIVKLARKCGTGDDFTVSVMRVVNATDERRERF